MTKMTVCRYNRRQMLASLSLFALTVMQFSHLTIAQDAPDNGTAAGTCDCVAATDAAKNAAEAAALAEINIFQAKVAKSAEETNVVRQDLLQCEENKSSLSTQYEKSIGELKKQLEESERNLAATKKELSDSEVKAAEVTSKSNDLAAKVESLESELANANTHLSDAAAKLSNSQKTIAEHTEASSKSAEKTAMLEGELTRTKEMLNEAKQSLQAETEKLRQSHAKDRAEIESNHNEALQKAVSLENSLTRVKTERDLRTAEMDKSIKSLTEDLEHHKKMLKNSKDKFFDTRQELFAANAELREMHERAGTTYCNTTLMMEDSTKMFSSIVPKATEFYDKFYAELFVPVSRTLSSISDMFVERTEEYYEKYLADHVEAVQKIVYELYEKHVEPIVEEHILPLVDKHSGPVLEAVESVRLTVVSVVKHSSKAAHAYLAVLEMDGDGLSMPVKWMLTQLKYCKDNSEEVVDTIAGYLPLFLFMMMGGCIILGTIAMKLGVPTGFVWAYCIIRILFGSRKKKTVGAKTTPKKVTSKKKNGKGKVQSQ